ncbi:HAUS augmin-like complex subunit 4 isoform X1 [Ovis canadensis]|uniref:HAUS augmin-like complex subunit 4 isoform X1 n=1 Tax=Ovis canadensis TaxID=37174 RepID=UPI003751E71E
MASGDFCSPGEGMEMLQQVCSKQLPPCNLSEEDLLQNPHFSQLLLSLSQHMDESGLSLTLAKEQAQAWKEVRLHKTTWLRSEILHRVIQELLVDYYVKTQDTDLTSEDRKFHETLEQRLLVTELTRLLGPSQEREVPPLLGLEKADLLELMPPSEDFVWMRARLPLEVEEQLKKKCFTVLCYHNPSSDLDSETLKAAKVWNLAEVLAGEKQQCQAAKSQQKEQMVLLEKKSATYSQVWQGSGVASLLFYSDPRGPSREARDFFGHAKWHMDLPQPGIEPVPPAVGAQNLNHWTIREFQSQGFLICLLFCCLLWLPSSSCLLGAQVLLRCLALLQRLLQEHRLKTQSELDRINAQYLEIKCSAMILKLRMEELKILSDTYTAEKVEVHRLIRDRLEGAIRLQEQDMEKSRQVLNTYEVLGEEFDKLVKEYTQLKQATENKRWTLQEFNKAYR